MKKNAAGESQGSFLKIHPDDNVLVALKDLLAGMPVSYNGYQFELVDNVAAKHKFFIRDMEKGEEVIMYGVLVGKLQENVIKGQVMTPPNTAHAAGKYAYRAHPYNWQPPDVPRFANKKFMLGCYIIH